jgi:hypothetical protein
MVPLFSLWKTFRQHCQKTNAIDECPATVVASKMERFTELFVRTLHGKGDTMREASL